MFNIEIYTHDEDSKIIEEDIYFLQDALNIAQNVPPESYKAICVNELDKAGNIIKVFHIDGTIMWEPKNETKNNK